MGRVKLGVIHICDATGDELPVGGVGEIYYENGQQFDCHKDPEKTKHCNNALGWTTPYFTLIALNPVTYGIEFAL